MAGLEQPLVDLHQKGGVSKVNFGGTCCFDNAYLDRELENISREKRACEPVLVGHCWRLAERRDRFTSLVPRAHSGSSRLR